MGDHADVDHTGLTGVGVAAATFNDHSARHENGGADEISIAGLDGTPVELTNHLGDATDAHDASAISFVPAGTIAATTVQAAIEEVASEAGSGAPPDCYEAFLAADVSITTAGTFQDIVSVSLPTGTYWVTGEGEATSASGSGTFVTMRIYDGTTVWAAKGARCWAGDAGGAANPSVSARVVVSGTTTVKIQGTSNRSTGDTIFRDQSQANGTADKCSVMHALKITAA